MRRFISIAVAMALAAASFAQSPIASVREVSGTVDAMRPGSKWAPAKAGLQLPKGTQVATGFRSSATIQLGDSLLTVKPLTQMTVEKLVQTGNLVKTDLYLRVGKVKADVVTPKGMKNDFKLKSPTATASVRGTAFEFDGDTLYVERGTVVMIASMGAERPITQGEGSKVERSGEVDSPRETAATATAIESLRDTIEKTEQGSAPSPIEVPAAAESASAAAAEITEALVPLAIVTADGTVTLVRPGASFSAPPSGAIIVVAAGPPVLVYPSGADSIALVIGSSIVGPVLPPGLATVVSTITAATAAASFPAGQGQATPTISATAATAAVSAVPASDTPTVSTTLPVGAYPSGLGSGTPTISASQSAGAFPSGLASGMPTLSATLLAAIFSSVPANASTSASLLLPPAAFYSVPGNVQPIVGVPANPFPNVYPVAPEQGDIVLSVQ